MADIFSVIADSTRRDILGVLLERRAGTGEASVSEIVEALGVPQPTVSKHLRTLRDAGLVTVREDGQHRHYAIVLAAFDAIDDWLMPFIFAEGEQDEASLGAAAFAAWAGVQVPAPLRAAADQARLAAEQALARMSETVEHPAPVGASLGRKAAEGMHDLQDRMQEARDRIHEVQERLHEMQTRASQRIDGAKGKLRKRDDDWDGRAARDSDDARLD